MGISEANSTPNPIFGQKRTSPSASRDNVEKLRVEFVINSYQRIVFCKKTWCGLPLEGLQSFDRIKSKADYPPIPEYYDDHRPFVSERAVASGQGSKEGVQSVHRKRRSHAILLCFFVWLMLVGGGYVHAYAVYVAHVNTWGWTGIQGQMPYWFVLFEDGEIYYDLPLEGLDGLDRTKLKLRDNEAWGHYDIQGSTGIFTRETYPDESIEVDDQGQITFREDTYRKLDSVNYMRLEGAWTYHIMRSDAFDPELYPDYKPIIAFARDGTFVDLGLFKADHLPIPEDYGTPGRTASMEPGQGWYEIRDFTLFLHYDDRRVRKAGFCVYYGEDLQEQPLGLYIYRTRLYMMD